MSCEQSLLSMRMPSSRNTLPAFPALTSPGLADQSRSLRRLRRLPGVGGLPAGQFRKESSRWRWEEVDILGRVKRERVAMIGEGGRFGGTEIEGPDYKVRGSYIFPSFGGGGGYVRK